MLHVNITKVRGHIELEIVRSGSVLADSVRASVPKVMTRYEIESPDDERRVAQVLRAARNGCFARAALSSPPSFEDSTTLNGKSISF